MLQAATLQRERIAREREADFEAYEAWEQERRLRDELTDAAERIRAPLANTAEFFLGPSGLTNDLGQDLRQIIVDGLEEARLVARTNPDWQVEVERRVIDLEEYDEIAALAERGEGAMVSYWLVPDAVRDGQSRLPGYNRERLKMFNRIAVATGNGVLIRYRSLDNGDRDGVAAMDRRLGLAAAPNRSSEQIARDRRHLAYGNSIEDLDLIDEQLRQAYDDAMANRRGGKWYAGRPAVDIVEALEFIKGQPQLIDAHMAIVNRVFALTNDSHERNRLLEQPRFNFAAALDDKRQGREVTSLEASGETAKAEGRSYDGDCPIGDGPTKAANQLENLGFLRKEKVRGPCPICKNVVEYDPCDPSCTECGATGKDPRPVKLLGKTATQARRANSPKKTISQDSRQHILPNGKAAVAREKLVVGGTQRYFEEVGTGRTVSADKL